MGKLKFLLNLDMFPQQADKVATKTWTGVALTACTIVGAVIYVYFYTVSALKNPFIETATTENTIGTTFPIRVKCRTAICYVSSEYTGFFGQQCQGGGIDGGALCKKLTRGQQETLKACYDPDPANGPKVLFAWPQRSNIPATPSDWLGWDFGVGIVVHQNNPKTGEPEDLELPVHYGDTLLALTVVNNLTIADESHQKSYQYAPLIVGDEGAVKKRAAFRGDTGNETPHYYNPCLKAQQPGIDIGPGGEGNFREARLNLMPTYQYIEISRRDLLTDILGAVGGFLSLLTKVGVLIVPIILMLRKWEKPVVSLAVLPNTKIETAKVVPDANPTEAQP